MSGKEKQKMLSEVQIEVIRSEMENDPDVIEDPNGERAQDYGEDLDSLEDDLCRSRKCI